MAYIGNAPAEAYSTISKQTITGNGTTGPYTLDYAVANGNEIEVFVNNVRQEPSVAYTVSGTALTMTGTVASTDDFYVVFQGKGVQTVTHPSGSALNATTGTFSGAITSGGNSVLTSASSIPAANLTGQVSSTGELTVSVNDASATVNGVTIQGTQGFGGGGYLGWQDSWSGDSYRDYRAAILGDVPASNEGRLRFFTASGGAISERARIDSSGNLGVGTTGAAARIHAYNSGNQCQMFAEAGSTSQTQDVLRVRQARSGDGATQLIVAQSSDGADNEFRVRSDGYIYADNTFNGGGADYAEYFEWADGNVDNEDRRGMSVSLVEDKIKVAEEGEIVIGVISAIPSVVGNADIGQWLGKYLKDDLGSYLWEDTDDVDENGNVLQTKVLNPNYDDSIEYISREDRPEWDTVGLMGKLRLRKGQLTGANWIKLRDISETVEEWLVR